MDNNSFQSNGGSDGGEQPPSNGRDQYLKHLNKLSYKIAKPTSSNNGNVVKNQNFDQSQNLNHNIQDQQPQSNSLFQSPPPLLFPPIQVQNQNQPLPLPPPPPQQQQPPLAQHHQPPVYNINKCHFREVVQKLTGAPPNQQRFSNPPPISQPRPPSSRLHRIRPPPLTHVPPPMMAHSGVLPPPPQPINNSSYSTRFNNPMMGNQNPNPNYSMPNPNPAAGNYMLPRSTGPTPMSPLPPLPGVHTSAESPISAYLRFLHSSSLGYSSSAPPPLPPQPPQQQPSPPQPQNQQFGGAQTNSGTASSSQPLQFQMPTSPLPFGGCLSSPLSPYPLLSPSLLLSPTSGQFGFPLSPTVQSPKWRGI